jgi:MFS family permease
MASPDSSPEHYRHGIRENLHQFGHQLGQVFLVGLTIGMMRTVVPALAESEFGVAEGSFMMLTSFVVAFGFVKGSLNFVAGRLSERIGRKKVLLLGWLSAIPIPFMVLYAPSWSWVVAATVLLGINQGLCWSMTQTAKMDITRADERGFTMGMNEFSGYVGVAVAGIVTGYLAMGLGPRLGLFVFSAAVIALAIVLTLASIRETHAWAKAESDRHASGNHEGPRAKVSRQVSEDPTTWEMLSLMSWRDHAWRPSARQAWWRSSSMPGVGLLPSVPLPAGLWARRHRLGGRHLWLSLGWLPFCHRPAVGSCRPP